MKCPFCTSCENKVTDSRTASGGDVIRRRRECDGCGRRFTTYERVEEVLPMVVKKDDRRELFDRRKVLAGLLRACEKRPVSLEVLEATVDGIERTLIDRGEKEVPAQVVGEEVMVALRALDPIAYVRFASVYRSFRDIDEFRNELDALARGAEAQGERAATPSPCYERTPGTSSKDPSSP